MKRQDLKPLVISITDKIKSKGTSIVKSKFLWRSIGVVLLITSASFFMLKERNLRIYTQRQLARTVEAGRLVENQLIKTAKAKRLVEGELAVEIERTLALEKEIKEKERQMKLALDRLEKEINARRQAETQLVMAVKEKRILKERLSKLVRSSGAINLDKIVVKPVPAVTGKVLVVNKEYAFVVVNLGKGSNVNIGDILSVYRDDDFIGRVEIEKVEEKISAATILPDWETVEFEEDDEVRKI